MEELGHHHLRLRYSILRKESDIASVFVCKTEHSRRARWREKGYVELVHSLCLYCYRSNADLICIAAATK